MVMHYLLDIVYGVVIVSDVHGAARTPSLTITLVFFFVLTEIAFAMITVLLSSLGLGELAWIGIFGGSLLGAAIAIVMLLRRHPLVALLHVAEDER